MIQIQKLCKAFGERVLFRDYDLSVDTGEYVTFAGPSGCGKTTLLHMIGGLEPFDSGRILVDGLDISRRRNQSKYFGETVGFLFQNFALMEDKTVEQNLRLVRGKSRSGLPLEEALERVGLADKAYSRIYTLSGGEQQRVALARLMLKRCSLILADEPTGSLDSGNAAAVMDILESLNREGKTLLVVTHDQAIMQRSHRLIRLSAE